MRYNVTVDGGHSAVVSLEVSGASFTGTVVSPDYGTGQISNGALQGDVYKGNVTLDGYDADFSAVIDGAVIKGTLSYGWFFSKDFTGSEAA